MKKLLILLSAGAALATTVNGQALQSGIEDYYAERYISAKQHFDQAKSSLETSYWLGQTFIADGDTAQAKTAYSTALAANPQNFYASIGLGQIDLFAKKYDDARQKFESVLTATRTKKGDDAGILTAIGRVMANAYNDRNKGVDINYAISKLETAIQRDPKNLDAYIMLGNAYKKAKPGENGGLAVQTYQKVYAVNPRFAVADYRIAQIYKSQRNWNMYAKYLSDAVAKDPTFAPAFYDLYWLRLQQGDYNEAEEYAKKFIANADKEPNNDYLRLQTLYVKKDYDGAIQGAKDLINKAGVHTRFEVYRLMANAYLDKKDSASAKQYIEKFFSVAPPEEINQNDYTIRISSLFGTKAPAAQIVQMYKEAAAADTAVSEAVDLVKQGADKFKAMGNRLAEADLLAYILTIKPKPTINDIFNAGRAYYFGGDYSKSRNVFLGLTKNYPDSIYGHEWVYNNSRAMDTVKKDSIAVPDAIKLLQVAQTNPARFTSQINKAAQFLSMYYANDAKDKNKAIEYLKIWQGSDLNNATTIQGYIDALTKQPAATPKTPAKPATPAKPGTKPAATSNAGKVAKR